MKKRILSLILMMLIFALSGCGESKLSGTYVSADDSSVSLVFAGNTVTMYEDGVQIRIGTFTESAKTASGHLLRIIYEGLPEERYWLDESKNTISHNVEIANEQGQTINSVGDVAFIKEN
jgi:uncharacterized lipoprotein YehR (DUF1307 family)